MGGTTGGICQASYVIREYHHILKERSTILSFSQLCCTGWRPVPITSSQVTKLEVTEIKVHMGM